MKNKNVENIAMIANKLRRHIVSVSSQNTAHLGGSISSIDLMAVLYFYYLRLENSHVNKDHFLLPGLFLCCDQQGL